VTRFDRHGAHGRSGLCSLQALDHALLGSQRQRWDHAAAKLQALGQLDLTSLGQIRLLQAFGQLIENTDMHFGNLSLRPGATLTLAPVYDMLPM
ncbi:HipA domain-containing protein, partial [Acinetobacter baumannii]